VLQKTKEANHWQVLKIQLNYIILYLVQTQQRTVVVVVVVLAVVLAVVEVINK
jgi:hypothetical protein